MPAQISYDLDPIRVELLASSPERVETHLLCCHDPRICDEVVFDHLIEALVTGCGYEKVADRGCAATTMQRRHDEWIALGILGELSPSRCPATHGRPASRRRWLVRGADHVPQPRGGAEAGWGPDGRVWRLFLRERRGVGCRATWRGVLAQLVSGIYVA